VSLLIIVASHRRSGTHWTIDSLRHNCPDIDKDCVNMDRLLSVHRDTITADHFFSCTGKNTLVKTHSPSTLLPFQKDNKLKEIERPFYSSRKVYVVRDGRDVMVSLYYYLQYMGIEFNSFSDFLRTNNEFDGYHMNRVFYWVLHVNSWLDVADVIVRYEDLHNDYENTVKSTIDVLGLRVNPKVVPVMLNSVRSSAVFPRQGMVGGWKKLFSSNDLEFFNDTASLVMERLGYEGGTG